MLGQVGNPQEYAIAHAPIKIQSNSFDALLADTSTCKRMKFFETKLVRNILDFEKTIYTMFRFRHEIVSVLTTQEKSNTHTKLDKKIPPRIVI